MKALLTRIDCIMCTEIAGWACLTAIMVLIVLGICLLN